MEVTVIGRKVTITDALNDYAVEKIGNAMKVLSIDIPKAEVVLRVEKNRAVPCICEVTIRPKGHTIHVEEHEEDMYAAIDVAAAKVLRQLRKYKTKVVDRKVRATEKVATGAPDASGRRAPKPVEGKTETLAVDTVILAIGQKVDTAGLPGLELTRKGGVVYDKKTFRTSLPGVFAAGDCTGQPLQLAKAVGEGQMAAHSAIQYLEQIHQGKEV